MDPLAESCGAVDDSPSKDGPQSSKPLKSAQAAPSQGGHRPPAGSAAEDEDCASVGTARYERLDVL